MSSEYTPPFTMKDEIVNIVIEIGELVGIISEREKLSLNPRLRRENRIRSIHSSLAIEQNSLTVDQVSDVINGKRVLGPPEDIQEVKNAFKAYELLSRLNPYRLEDLLYAHKIMMWELEREAGIFRSKGVGVYAGNSLIHAGTPPQYVPELMKGLFEWVAESEYHPLIKSGIFHYEFEFIHPFADGNGRTGRLWHTLILSKWKPFFVWLPVETLIYEHQEEYYQALNASNTEGEATIFVTFILEIIRDTLRELSGDRNAGNTDVGVNVGANVGVNVGLNTTVQVNIPDKVLSLLKDNPKMTAGELAVSLNRTKRQIERTIAALKKAGKLERVGASKNGYWKVG